MDLSRLRVLRAGNLSAGDVLRLAAAAPRLREFSVCAKGGSSLLDLGKRVLRLCPRLEVLEILNDVGGVDLDRNTELELLRDGPVLRYLNLGRVGEYAIPRRVGEYMFDY